MSKRKPNYWDSDYESEGESPPMKVAVNAVPIAAPNIEQPQRKFPLDSSNDNVKISALKDDHVKPANTVAAVSSYIKRPYQKEKPYYESESSSDEQENTVNALPQQQQQDRHVVDDDRKIAAATPVTEAESFSSEPSHSKNSPPESEENLFLNRASRKIRNPIQESRQQQEHLRKLFEVQVCSKVNEDELWKSDDEEEQRAAIKKPVVEKRKRKKAKSDEMKGMQEPWNIQDQEDQEDISLPEPSSSSPPDPLRASVRTHPDEDSQVEDEYLLQQLKPEFVNPKLGPPSDLVPLPLTRSASMHDSAADPAAGNDPSPVVDQVPASINRYLQEYQRAGIKFMHSILTNGLGAILGDDMGLGKTVQVIALLAAFEKKTGSAVDAKILKQRQRMIQSTMNSRLQDTASLMLTGRKDNVSRVSNKDHFTPTLIIVPPSVIANWKREFDTWGHFAVSVYHGSEKERQLELVRIGINDVMICGKSHFIDDAHFACFEKIPWQLVVVDEFHEYKNVKIKCYKHLDSLRETAKCPILGLTGTLMSNNHEELWSLIDLVQPNHLGALDAFKKYISGPIKHSRRKDATEVMIKLGDERQRSLKQRLATVWLKREKADVLKDSLTLKDEKIVFCELSGVQKTIYQRLLSLADFKFLRLSRTPCDCGVNQKFFIGYRLLKTRKEQLEYTKRNKKFLKFRKDCCYKKPYMDDRVTIDPEAALWHTFHENGDCCLTCPFCLLFPALNKLYKVCSHPTNLQIERQPDFIQDQREREKAMKDLEFAKVALTEDILEILPGKSCIRDDSIMDDHIMLSGKMEALDYYLHSYYRAANKVLIFSYSTKSLDMIQNYVTGKGYTYLRLDGSVPTGKRQTLIDQFQTDKGIFLFLISTRAGGLGLNLTAASRVIIYDVNWNPSHDEQAQDRAYRIGQVEDVEVIRLVAQGTIEELMYARQLYKVQLKKKTLEITDDPSVPQAARMFCGVDKDIKGELFGIENMFKYKDGSFISELWKSTVKVDIPSNKKIPVAISTEKVAECLGKCTEEQIMNLGIVEAIPEFETIGNDDEQGEDDTVIRHANFFREDLGVAVHNDEFMGGETQMDLIACDMAINNLGVQPQGCNDIDDGESFGHKPAIGNTWPTLPSPQESKDAENVKPRSSLIKLPGYMKKK